VVIFVLNYAGEETVCLELKWFEVLIPRNNFYAFRAVNLAFDAGNTETSLFEGFVFFAFPHNFRIDEDLQAPRQRIIVFLVDIDDEKTLEHANLSRRKPYATRGIHGLSHCLNELAFAAAYAFQIKGFFAQKWMTVVKNFQS
jgi:hypothetical protein